MTARLTAALAAAVLFATGCGGDDEPGRAAATPPPEPAKQVRPVGDETAGSVVQYANCGDWRAGTPAERRVTIEVIRGQLTPQSSRTAASPLADERAYEILQKACSPDYADSLRLYKLYARAQGFSPLYD